MHRVPISKANLEGDRIRLDSPEELHHLRTVLRLREGDLLECFDGEGRSYRGHIEAVLETSVVIAVDEAVVDKRTGVEIALLQALIRPSRFEWVIQKATELNVGTIIPCVTERTLSRPGDGSLKVKQERWQRIAVEAAKQCGRATVPEVRTPAPFESLLDFFDNRLVVLATLAVPGQTIDQVLRSADSSQGILLAIGPEGDFTRKEVEAAVARGAVPVTLRTHTLRSETAALALTAILQYALGGV